MDKTDSLDYNEGSGSLLGGDICRGWITIGKTLRLRNWRTGFRRSPRLWAAHWQKQPLLCLENQYHAESCFLTVRYGEKTIPYLLWRLTVTDQIDRAYHDLQEATELGACGIAILIAMKITGYTLVQRSVKGTGFDYWLGVVASEESLEPMERKARLEVSGILHGAEVIIEARVQEKIRQTRQSAGEHPAFVIVVEFSRPLAYMVKE